MPLILSGSIDLTGSIIATRGFTGSLHGTASYALEGPLGSVRTTGSTIYSYDPSTTGVNTTESIFLGLDAGYNATLANNSVFLNTGAGYGATNAAESNFIGYQAGGNATNANISNFLGYQAGLSATNAQYSNFIGLNAGRQATNAYNSNFIGALAGFGATNAANSNFIGSNTGNDARHADNSNFVGNSAGNQAVSASYSTFIGTQAGYQATNAAYSTFIGSGAGEKAINANYSNFIGAGVGYSASAASSSNFIGYNAGAYSINASYSTFIGYYAGYEATQGPRSVGINNIIIGTNITLPSGSRNSINIGGVIFATGSYGTTTGNPFSGSVQSARVGISTRTPLYTLHVSGTVGFPNLTDSNTADKVVLMDNSGQLFITASSALSVVSTTPMQIATGSVTASVNIGGGNVFTVASASITEFAVAGTGVTIGNALTDVHRVTGSINATGSLRAINGAGSMATNQYENIVSERNGDLKMGVYTSVANFTSGGAAIAFGYSNVTASSTYYPGFEIQMFGSNTQSQNRVRFNSLERNTAGLVLGSYNDILSIFDDGRVALSASLSGTKTGGNGSKLIVGATSSAYTFDVDGDGNFRNNLTVTGSTNLSGSIYFPDLQTPVTLPTNILMISSSGQVFATASTAVPSRDPYYISAYSTSSQDLTTADTYQAIAQLQIQNSLGITYDSSDGFYVPTTGVYRVDLSITVGVSAGEVIVTGMQTRPGSYIGWSDMPITYRIYEVYTPDGAVTSTNYSSILNLDGSRYYRFIWKGVADPSSGTTLIGSGSVASNITGLYPSAYTYASALINITEVANNYYPIT